MFFVTTIQRGPAQAPAQALAKPRCVGYFETLEQARAVLQKNQGELDEGGYYTLAVIEEIKPGLYQYADRDHRWWYAYHTGVPGPGTGWGPCAEPDWYRRTIGFAIG